MIALGCDHGGYELKQEIMARTVNYPKRAEKIKEMIDDLVKEMGHSPRRMAQKNKIKLIDIDFENVDVVTLMQVQARISRIILDRSK